MSRSFLTSIARRECVCVCSAERRGLLPGLFQEWILGGLQELLNEMEGSGQEWWEGARWGRLLYTIGGVSGSHLQAWLNNRMLYENKDIICLLKGREKPSNWLPLSLCCRPSVREQTSLPVTELKLFKTLSLSFSQTPISTIEMYQHTETNPRKKRVFLLPDWVQ